MAPIAVLNGNKYWTPWLDPAFVGTSNAVHRMKRPTLSLHTVRQTARIEEKKKRIQKTVHVFQACDPGVGGTPRRSLRRLVGKGKGESILHCDSPFRVS